MWFISANPNGNSGCDKIIGTQPFIPGHIRSFNGLNYVINIIHNPLVVAALIIFTYGYIQTFQLVELCQIPVLVEDLNVDDYFLDFISNIINLLFLLRFSILARFPFLIELGLFIIELGLLFIFSYNYYLNVVPFTNSWNYIFTNGLYYCQVICPLILNLVNVVELYNSNITFHRFFINSNNNYLPVFLTNSFQLINLYFPIFFTLETNCHNEFEVRYMFLCAYKILIISVKFYCLYQYILFELLNNFNNEFIDFKTPINYYNYYLILALLIISGFDVYFVFRF